MLLWIPTVGKYLVRCIVIRQFQIMMLKWECTGTLYCDFLSAKQDCTICSVSRLLRMTFPCVAVLDVSRSVCACTAAIHTCVVHNIASDLYYFVPGLLFCSHFYGRLCGVPCPACDTLL